MKVPEISILVPAFNVESYIKDCLNSLIHQTFTDFEVIVVDDGSTDNTGNIIDEYAEKYEKVHVYHQKNKGVVKTRSRLMSLATGNYVGWVDADDFVDVQMFEKLYLQAKSEDADVVICNYRFYPHVDWKKLKWYKTYKGVLDWNFVDKNTQHWNKLVKRELIDQLDIIEWSDYCGEGAYALLLLKAGRISTIDDELYNYRVGHISLSNNYKKSFWYELNTVKSIRLREVIHFLGLDDEWGDYFDFCISFAYIQAMIVASYNGNMDMYKRMKEENLKNNMTSKKYTKLVLDSEYGAIKSFVMRHLIPSNYHLASIISRIALG